MDARQLMTSSFKLKSVAPGLLESRKFDISICMRNVGIEKCKFGKMCKKNILKAFNISK